MRDSINGNRKGDGGDGIPVEMMKVDPELFAKLITSALRYMGKPQGNPR